MIYYRCKVCGCVFGVKKIDVDYAEYNHIYIACPLDGRHDKLELIKELMEECKGVEL